MTTAFYFINTGPAILIDEEKSSFRGSTSDVLVSKTFKINKLLNYFVKESYEELDKFGVKNLELDLTESLDTKRIYKCQRIYVKDNKKIKDKYYINPDNPNIKYDVIIFGTSLDVRNKMDIINNYISTLDGYLLYDEESLFKIKEEYKSYIDGSDIYTTKQRVMKYTDKYRLKIKPKFVRTFLAEVSEIINKEYICSVYNRNDITKNIFLIESSKVHSLFNYFEKLYEYKFDIEE
jgi:hypothetical protein